VPDADTETHKKSTAETAEAPPGQVASETRSMYLDPDPYHQIDERFSFQKPGQATVENNSKIEYFQELLVFSVFQYLIYNIQHASLHVYLPYQCAL